jgi:hypothetical protein
MVSSMARHDGVVRRAARALALGQEVQHQRAGPDHGDRVGDVLAVDVGRRAVHRLEQAGEGALGVQVGRGRDADGAGGGRAQVAEDVAEQVGGGHHVEALRLQHEARGEDVDVLLVQRDLGVARLADFVGALVPPGHADGDAVALGGHRDVLAGRLWARSKAYFSRRLAPWR